LDLKSHDVIYAEEEATVLATTHFLKISRYINGKASVSLNQ
ncbi:unnamed protein product, partial [Brassica napus]